MNENKAFQYANMKSLPSSSRLTHCHTRLHYREHTLQHSNTSTLENSHYSQTHSRYEALKFTVLIFYKSTQYKLLYLMIVMYGDENKQCKNTKQHWNILVCPFIWTLLYKRMYNEVCEQSYHMCIHYKMSFFVYVYNLCTVFPPF